MAGKGKPGPDATKPARVKRSYLIDVDLDQQIVGLADVHHSWSDVVNMLIRQALDQKAATASDGP